MAQEKYLSASKWIFLPLWLSVWVSGLDAAVLRHADIKSVLTNPAQTWSQSTTISFPETAQFVDATERWTMFNPPTYSAAISPGSEEDVIGAVKLATSNNIPFLATGGRHSYSKTLGDLHDGLAIDLSQLKSIEIDETANTVTVGPGVIMDDILDPLYDAGFILQTGTAFCPSVIGVTLGGGVGRFQGLYGLIIDALVSVRLVTGDGELVEVSQNTNPDLFWAIRGAGANFGIITSATYKVHPLPNAGNIFTVDFTFPANLSSKFFKAVESMHGKLPPELAGNAFIAWNATTNQTQTVANWMYLGSEEQARKVLAPIYDVGGYNSGKVVPWNKLINSTSDGLVARICEPGGIHDIYSLNLRNYDAATYDKCFDKISNFFQKHPGGRTSAVQFDFYPNQAMSAIPVDETAWPWRDATGFMNAGMTWDEGDNVTANAAMAVAREVRAAVAATSGYPDVSVFINYARGDERLEQIYGSVNLPRLTQLKKIWDPNHIFSYNNGLPTNYS